MIGISNEMLALIRESLAQDSGNGFLPVPEMDGYYVSRELKQEPDYQFMYTATVEGKDVHVYVKF